MVGTQVRLLSQPVCSLVTAVNARMHHRLCLHCSLGPMARPACYSLAAVLGLAIRSLLQEVLRSSAGVLSDAAREQAARCHRTSNVPLWAVKNDEVTMPCLNKNCITPCVSCLCRRPASEGVPSRVYDHLERSSSRRRQQSSRPTGVHALI